MVWLRESMSARRQRRRWAERSRLALGPGVQRLILDHPVQRPQCLDRGSPDVLQERLVLMRSECLLGNQRHNLLTGSCQALPARGNFPVG